jgi:hypothetical protein
MTNLPKFISIRASIYEVTFINVNNICRVELDDRVKFMKVWLNNSYVSFKGADYPTAKAAWLEYWKVSP